MKAVVSLYGQGKSKVTVVLGRYGSYISISGQDGIGTLPRFLLRSSFQPFESLVTFIDWSVLNSKEYKKKGLTFFMNSLLDVCFVKGVFIGRIS